VMKGSGLEDVLKVIYDPVTIETALSGMLSGVIS